MKDSLIITITQGQLWKMANSKQPAHWSAIAFKPLTREENYIDHLVKMKCSVGNLGFWNSCGCYFDKYHKPKHGCRPSTPWQQQNTEPCHTIKTGWGPWQRAWSVGLAFRFSTSLIERGPILQHTEDLLPTSLFQIPQTPVEVPCPWLENSEVLLQDEETYTIWGRWL